MYLLTTFGTYVHLGTLFNIQLKTILKSCFWGIGCKLPCSIITYQISPKKKTESLYVYLGDRHLVVESLLPFEAYIFLII